MSVSSNTLTLPACASTIPLSVAIVDDDIVEVKVEQTYVLLSTAVDNNATINITDNDGTVHNILRSGGQGGLPPNFRLKYTGVPKSPLLSLFCNSAY